MNTIVLYYSLLGATKTNAERIANEKGAVICRVEEVKRRNILTAFIPGAPNAMKRKASNIKALGYDLKEFDRIIICSPIWAGFPVPAFNAIVALLPAGKEVELFICSGGGLSLKSEEGTKELITAKDCRLISYTDIKTGK